VSDPPRPDPSSPAGDTSGSAHSLAAGLSATAHRVEHAVEETLEHGIAVAEQTIVRRFGLGALLLVRRTVRFTFWTFVAAYFVFGALLLVTRYAVLPNIDAWRPDIERLAGRALNARVTIGRIDAGWRAFNPHLALNEVSITGPRGGKPLGLPRVEATVSWLSVVALEPRFTTLRVLSPELTVTRLPGGELAVAGFVLEPGKGDADESPALDWLLAQRRLVVRDATVLYRDERTADARQLQFEELTLMVEQSLGTHSFGLQARPTSSVAAPLDVRGVVRTGAFARSSDISQWKGELFGQVDYADLAVLSRFVDVPVRIDQALGAVRGWVGFDGGAISRVTADVAVQDVVTRLGPDLPALELSSLQGRFTQRRWSAKGPAGHGGQEFTLVRTTLQTAAGNAFPPLDLRLRLTRAAGNEPQRTELEASRLDLGSLTAVAAHLPLPPELRASVARRAMRGTVSNLAVHWNGESPTMADITLRSNFSGLGITAQAAPESEGNRAIGVPGFENLSGTVRMDRGSGRLEVASTDAALVFPGVFARPRLPLKQLAGTFHWIHRPELEVRAEGVRLVNDDAEIVGSGSYLRTPEGPGMVDLNGRIVRAEARTAFRYIPQVAGSDTLKWLEHALVSGRMTDGSYRVKGDLARFPFVDPADGEFRIAGRVTDATLDVFPAAGANGQPAPAGTIWPVLSGIDADLLFERASMTINAQRGRAYGARIEQATAHIPHLGDSPLLKVRGQASGPLAEMVRYVNDSPVNRWIGRVTEGSETQGNARLDLQLEIPLAHADDTKVEGAVALQNNNVALVGLPTFSRATGTLNFNERGVRISNLATGLLGGQAQLDASTRADGALVFTASGTATPAGLRPAVPIAPVQRLLDRTQGTARYQATVTVKDGTELQVDSDLVGFAIDGIAPLRKNAQDSLPLRIERTSRSGGDDLYVQAGRTLGVRIERRAENGTMRLTRGVVALNEAANLPERGLLVLVSIPRLDVDAWSTFLAGDATALRPGRPVSPSAEDPQVDLVAVRTAELVVYGHVVRNVTLGASRLPDGGYESNIVSDGATGYVAWRPPGSPQGTGHLTARLSRLVIAPSKEQEVIEVLRAPPKEIPSVEIRVDEFELSDKKLGRLDLVARNVGAGNTAAWRLQRLDITNPDMKLAATGDWAPAAAGAARRMQMKFQLDAFDAGGALSRIGFPGALAKGAGRVDGELEWTGSPLDIDYPSLSGRVNLSLDDGRFLKVETGGAARLLALLSLQSLGRTLAADGGRQFEEGFAFASIRADAAIERGVLKTDTFRMNGASAAVMMSGTIDLGNETQQLAIVVLPEIDASTAALALGVANPVLGLGAFLAQYVLRNPLSKAFALQYDVSGTWDEPKVNRRSRITPTTETDR
jgi:uncharacterized protein (TIGR02099 family)